MAQEEIYLSVLGWFFMMSTACFFLLAYWFFRRMLAFKRRVETVCAELDEKKKELEQKGNVEKELMVPFGSPASKSIILSLNPAGEVTYMNEAAEELFGYDKADILGHKAAGRLFPRADDTEQARPNLIARIFAHPRLYLECETENIKKSGERVFLSWTNRVTYDENGRPAVLHCVGFDISRRKRLEQDLTRLACRDALTGVLNRQAFLRAGDHEAVRATAYGRPMAVAVMKLAYFHDPLSGAASSFSDCALQEIITQCRRLLRAGDVVGRIDDVAFAFLLPETDMNAAKALTERLKKKVREKSFVQGDGFVTALFGVATLKKNDASFDFVLVRALMAASETKAGSSDKTKEKQIKKKG